MSGLARAGQIDVVDGEVDIMRFTGLQGAFKVELPRPCGQGGEAAPARTIKSNREMMGNRNFFFIVSP
jgi:hypothetical protein